MNIRSRLTYQFASIVAMLMVLSSVAIYYFSAENRKENFYERLKSKASNTAKLLIDVDEISADLLLKIERDNPSSLPYEKIKVYDFQNKLLFSTDETNVIEVNNNFLDEIRLKQDVRFKATGYEGLGFLFTGRYDRFVVVAVAKDVNGFNHLKNLRTVLLIVFGASIVLIFISGRIYAGRALRPISSVINQVDNISASHLDMRVDQGTEEDEIAKLAQTFNNMLGRIETAFNVQKNFIANASHELRTPLTVITGQLEVTLMKTRSIDEYKSTMESILEDMRSLNTISNRLLLLAQTSTENAEGDFTPLRVDEVMWQARTDLLRLKKEYTIDITMEGDLVDESQLMINGNEALLKTAITNLMDNGCKYSADHKVSIHMFTGGNKLFITFQDHGIGIAPDDIAFIFDPFYRGKNAIQIKGHGIGLSLVQRIIQLHGGTVGLESKVNEGTIFTLSFSLLKV